MKARRNEPIHLSKHKQKFVNSLLPDVVSKDGTTLTIPEKWNQPYIPPVQRIITSPNLMDLYTKHFGVAQIIEFDHPNMPAFIKDLNFAHSGLTVQEIKARNAQFWSREPNPNMTVEEKDFNAYIIFKDLFEYGGITEKGIRELDERALAKNGVTYEYLIEYAERRGMLKESMPSRPSSMKA
jgi:hypothetical protein